MKTKLLILSIFICSFFFGQDSLKQDLKIKSALVTFNPSKVAKNTNGINLGILDEYQKQRINGINLQANPITLLYLLIPKAIEVPKEGEETATLNGLHISTGGMMNGKKLNGIGISMYHIAQETNGISLNGFNSKIGKMNGLQISWLNNSIEKGNGLQISISNNSEKFNGFQMGLINEIDSGNGVQIGFYNSTKKLKGVQVGIINKSEGRGFQIGFWNKNSKRTLPILNF
ncbi:hypothetical protein D3C87_392700 [compost metagenome]